MGCHFLLQGIFLAQGSNLRLFCLLHWQADSLPQSHLGISVQASELTEVICSVHTSVIWGQYPVFPLHPLRVLCWERPRWLRTVSGRDGVCIPFISVLSSLRTHGQVTVGAEWLQSSLFCDTEVNISHSQLQGLRIPVPSEMN